MEASIQEGAHKGAYQVTGQQRHCEVWRGKFYRPPRNHSKCGENQAVDDGSMKAMEGYFDNLAAAVVNEKLVLEQLVVNNTKLAANNESLVAMVKKMTGNIKNLEHHNARLKKGGKNSWGPTLYHHCKREGYHVSDACYELAKNKDNRPPGWISLL